MLNAEKSRYSSGKIIIYTLMFFAFASLVNAQWIPGNIGTNYNLTAVSIPEGNSSYVWVVGYDSANYMTKALYKSSNSGATWTTLNTFPANFYYPTSIAFTDANTGFVCGAGGLLGTYNSGLNWSYLYALTPPDTVVFWDFGIGPFGSMWAIGNKTNNGQFVPVILRSAKGLGSFDFKRLTLPPAWIYQLTAVCVKDSNNCVISTNTHSPSIMLKTTNGGLSWAEISFAPYPGRDFWGLVGDDFTNDIIAVGGVNDGTTIYSSNDFGSSWSMLYDNMGSGRLKSIGSPFGYIRDTMYAVGEKGTILRTINSGANWNQQNSGVTRDLESVSYMYRLAKFAIAVGDNGSILMSSNAFGIYQISSEIPSTYSLSQNYPNPFNPSTNIKFELPKSNYVTLKIYDALGSEVATLVNEQLKPGTYQVDWPAPSGEASSYASGVYYYKLTAGDFVETRKMVLVK